MMRQMRENTKWIMLFTALAFVALMVFEWGMDLTGRNAARTGGGELGSVNGETISADEFQMAYRNLYREQQAQLGDQAITGAMNRQIEDAAWEQLVTSKLIEQELRRRGIRVSNEEIVQGAQFAPPPELMNNELFLTDGQFDLDKYQSFLRQGLDDQTLLQLEAYYRDVIPRSKLYFQATAGVHVSDALLWRMWQDANESVQIRFLAWDPTAMVPESEVQVSQAAIRQYYNERRDDFIRSARASIRYLIVDRTPAAQDSTAALEQARTLRARVLAGESFDDVARELTADTAPAQRTSMRVIRNAGAVPPAFEQAAFAAPVGQVSEPILTQYGYHVIRVDSRAGDTASIGQVLVRVGLSEAVENALFERADSLESFAEDGLRLEEIGRRMNLQVGSTELAPPVAMIPELGTAEDGVDWAFREGEAGEVSPLFEEPNAYYMIELVSRVDEGPLSLQEATPAIRAILVRRQQVESARQRLQEAVSAARSGQSLEQIAARFDSRVQQAGPFTRSEFVPGLGRLNAAVGAAFGLPRGGVSDLVEANQQLYLIQTVARTDADRTAWQQQLAEQRQRVQTARADERWQQYLRGLHDNAKIVDNRAALRRQQVAAVR